MVPFGFCHFLSFFNQLHTSTLNPPLAMALVAARAKVPSVAPALSGIQATRSRKALKCYPTKIDLNHPSLVASSPSWTGRIKSMIPCGRHLEERSQNRL